MSSWATSLYHRRQITQDHTFYGTSPPRMRGCGGERDCQTSSGERKLVLFSFSLFPPFPSRGRRGVPLVWRPPPSLFAHSSSHLFPARAGRGEKRDRVGPWLLFLFPLSPEPSFLPSLFLFGGGRGFWDGERGEGDGAMYVDGRGANRA